VEEINVGLPGEGRSKGQRSKNDKKCLGKKLLNNTHGRVRLEIEVAWKSAAEIWLKLFVGTIAPQKIGDQGLNALGLGDQGTRF